MNILYKYEEKKNKVRFFFNFLIFFYLFVFLENTYYVRNSMGNEPVEGAITSFLKH